LGLFPVDQVPDPRADLILPAIALIDFLVQLLALRFARKAADPYVEILILLSHEAADDDHALRDLKGDDRLLHVLDPVLPLPWSHTLLSKLEEHPATLP